jgi:Lon protease-like protein
MPGHEILRALPVFPLPNVVFLPGMVLPLNVFEPRYLDLVDHVLEGGQHIGVPLLRDGGKDGKESELPEFEQVFGIGKLVAHHRLPDGRRFIRLEGLGRVQVLEELPFEHRFRRVRVRPLPEEAPIDMDAFEILKAQVERMARTFDEDEQEMVCSVLRLEDPRVIIYAIASLVPNVELLRAAELGRQLSPRCQLELQQECLDARTADERIHLLLERAEDLIDELGSSGVFPATMLN